MNCRKTSLNKPTGNKAIQGLYTSPFLAIFYMSLSHWDVMLQKLTRHASLIYITIACFTLILSKWIMKCSGNLSLCPGEFFINVWYLLSIQIKKKLNAENNRNTCQRILSPFRWLIPPILTVLAMCHLQKRSDHIIKQFHIDYHFTICQEKCSNDSTKQRRKSN